MSTARDAILARIRAVERSAAPTSPAVYRRLGALTSDARVALFCDRVSGYRADVRRVGTGEVAAAVAEALRTRGAVKVGIPRDLPTDWRPQDVDLVADHNLSACELDALDGVVTACTVAIAETGTVILTSG